MKLLVLSWENFGTVDILAAFSKTGIETCVFRTSQEELLAPGIGDGVTAAMKDNTCDAVFGFNYFPYVAEAAHKHGYDYYSWVYDNPSVQLYSMTVRYPTNHIHIFDSDTYLTLKALGIDTVSFLPMAATPAEEHTNNYICDLSFVGSMYNEEHNFYDRMMDKGVSGYTQGYVRGIMEAQKRLYGINLAEKMLTDPVIDDMYKALPLEPAADSFITKRILFAEYVINRKVTAEERLHMLSMIGGRFGASDVRPGGYRIWLYTREPRLKIDGCVNKGSVDADMARSVYSSSRINLNISLRSIVNGIPLRCFDIMGAGGFLLSSYAGDFGMFFNEGEDYIAYTDTSDLADKCGYYLTHEDERISIAQNGLEKIREAHTFTHRVREMFRL